MIVEPRWRPGSLAGPFAVAEQIASRDFNNLYRTSCYFDDLERYRAFCAYYAVMRVVDDRIDAIPARVELNPRERQQEHAVVNSWAIAVDRASSGDSLSPQVLAATEFALSAELAQAFAAAAKRFPVSLILWRNFFEAMHRDIEQPHFETYEQFVAYAQGATVAPTTIYLHLISAESTSDHSRYEAPVGFQLNAAGESLGLFAYLGHILRDLPEDLTLGREGLLYISAEDLSRHGLDRQQLFQDLERRNASPALRALVLDLIGRARQYLSDGRELLVPLDGRLPHDRRFILELILAIYEAVLDRIEQCDGDVMAGRHHLSDSDKQAIALDVARRAGGPD